MKKFTLILRRFINRILIGTRLSKPPNFIFTPFIYVNQNGEPSLGEITTTIRFLDDIVLSDMTYEDAEMKMWGILNAKYPEYKGYLWVM